jgi:uncharacterized phosphosugar-binding protein
MTTPPSAGISNSAQYFAFIAQLLNDLQRDEVENVNAAAGLMVEQIRSDGLIHVFGVSGHSVIGCEEFFWRAGGLCNVNPLFDLSLMLSGGGFKSTMLERVPGIGDKVISSALLQEGDLLVITSIYGMNAATIDAALEAKHRGAKIIAITSADHARRTPADFVARHPSKKNLFELADVVIDNHVPHGDTVVEVPGCRQPVGAVSTILVSSCIQWLVIETTRLCAESGIEAPVWQSANTVGGDERNAAYLEKFRARIKAL